MLCAKIDDAFCLFFYIFSLMKGLALVALSVGAGVAVAGVAKGTDSCQGGGRGGAEI